MSITVRARRELLAARMLLGNPHDESWLENYVNPPLEGAVPADVPPSYAAFLRVADGAACGAIVLESSIRIESRQVVLDSDGVPVVSLGQDDWFCVGDVYENPVMLSRRDGSVWAFTDVATHWWDSDRFEKVAEDISDFVERRVFGAGYAELTEGRDHGSWPQVLSYLHVGSGRPVAGED